MAYEAERTTVGLEFKSNRSTAALNPNNYLLTPGVAFPKGAAVVLTNGKLALCDANSSAGIVGAMAESIAAADNPAGTDTYGRVYDNPLNVYRVSFTGQLDNVATAGDTTTVTRNGAFHAGLVGAMIYIYEGAAAGSVRTIKTATADAVTVEKPFPVAIDATSKYIVLGVAGANGAINVGYKGLYFDATGKKANAGKTPAAGGPLVPVAIDPKNLWMDVMIRSSLHYTG